MIKFLGAVPFNGRDGDEIPSNRNNDPKFNNDPRKEAQKIVKKEAIKKPKEVKTSTDKGRNEPSPSPLPPKKRPMGMGQKPAAKKQKALFPPGLQFAVGW